jgi:hypothetical protein
MIGGLRALGSDFIPKPNHSETNTIVTYFMQRAGQRPFLWASPDGYPDEKEYWSGGTILINVMRFFDWMLDENTYDPDRIVPMMDITLNASVSDLPSHSPNHLTSFWMKLIFGYEPDGGWLGTTLHTSLRDFMRQNSIDPQQWPADEPLLDISENTYPYYFHERLRGLVKLLLSSPDFLYR